MPNFWTLVRFEYSKLFQKKTSILGIILCAVLIILSASAMVISLNTESDYNDDALSNYDALLLDKSYELALSGRILDENLILEAAHAYGTMKPYLTEDLTYTNTLAYAENARAYSSVYTLIDSAYAHRGKAFNVESFMDMTASQAGSYYDIRLTQLRENLTNNPLWSSTDVDIVLAMDRSVTKPFVMAYNDGYERTFALTSLTILLTLFMLSYSLSPIMSLEYRYGTDALILSSRNGKIFLTLAKLFVAFSFSLFLFLFYFMTAFITCLIIYGTEGLHSSLQLIIPLNTYAFTVFDCLILVMITGLVGTFLHTSICLFLSAKSQNPVIPMAVSTALIIIGLFNGINAPVIGKLRYLLPSSLGSFYEIIKPLIYHIGPFQFPLYQWGILFGLGVTLLLTFTSFYTFRNHQIVK